MKFSNPSKYHLSLFTGIGGLDLAAEMAGFQTVGQCEWADYPTKVLEKHWPDVPRWRDIRTLTGESFYERTGLRTVDVISGGFPCQPFSFAGERRGQDVDRYLWPQMFRVISELRPTWVVGENVAGIVNMALDTVLSDLESIGYSCQAFIIPACSVDAPHRRDRCAIVAHSEIQRRHHWEDGENKRAPNREIDAPTDTGLSFSSRSRRTTQPVLGGVDDGPACWLDEPLDVPRMAKDIPNRKERLKCLGNAVVPQQFYPIFKAISEVIDGEQVPQPQDQGRGPDV